MKENLIIKKNILFEDNHLLVIDKPSGVAVQGGKKQSLNNLAKEYLREKYNKPGEAWLGVVHRLDQATSGVVVLAKTSKAAARLSRQFREKKVEKFYQCIISYKEREGSVLLENWIKREQNRALISKRKTTDSKKVLLKYRKVRDIKGKSLFIVKLLTGHYHQIRAQLAFKGFPVLGDKKYGSDVFLGKGVIALNCHKMVLQHPVSRKKITFKSKKEISALI